MKISEMMKGKGMKKGVDVSVHLKSDGYVTVPYDEAKYLKKDLKHQKEKVLQYQKVLDEWVPEDIAAMAKEKLEKELAEAKLTVRETRARLKLRGKGV